MMSILLLTGCCIFQGPQEPDIRYIHEKEYILPNLPSEILEPVDIPEKRVWSTEDFQGEVGRYILKLNSNLEKANSKIVGIKEYLDKLEADINDVHNSSKD